MASLRIKMNDNNEDIKLEFDECMSGASLKVVGIGGGGCNAVNRMIEAGIEGVEFIAANTDVQALRQSRAAIKLQLGAKLTKGLGAGADPEVGRQAALEDTEKIIELLEGSDMVFITAGLGGGTGGGSAPIISSLASELGALTVAVVTKPFHFEGKKRMSQAEQALAELKEGADTVITIPNERLLTAVPPQMSLVDAFKFADDVLRQALKDKQPYASYMTTQMCFDPAIISNWISDVRADGITLPIHLGMPGVAPLHKLISISARIGVGDSVRFLSRHRGLLGRLTRQSTYSPDRLANGLSQVIADPEANIGVVHLYTFNQVESSEAWRQDWLAAIDGWGTE